MSTHPAWVGVGAEPGMDHCQSRLIIWVLQIVKKLPQLSYQKHPLIYNGPAAHGNHIRIVIALLKYPSGHIQLPLKFQPFGHSRRLADKSLNNIGHLFHSLLSNPVRMNGQIPPSKERKPFLFHNNLQHLPGLTSGQLVLGKEKHSHSILPLSSQFNPKRFCHLLKKAMGNLH